jgi:hypothetical protein
VFREGEALLPDSLGLRLASEGFDVSFARTFPEAALLFAPGRADLFLFHLPQQEWVRNAILSEARRANPRLRIIALAASASDGVLQLLARLGVSKVLPVSGNWRGILDSIRETLASNAAPEGMADATAPRGAQGEP